MKELCLTPGGPVSMKIFFFMCDKKASGRESAEVIVGVSPHTEGPNVNVVRVTANNARTVRNRG